MQTNFKCFYFNGKIAIWELLDNLEIDFLGLGDIDSSQRTLISSQMWMQMVQAEVHIFLAG